MGHSSLVATCFVVSSLALGGAACTDSDGAIRILQNQVADQGCVVPSSLGSFLPRGSIDTNSEQGYFLNPLVENTAISSTGQDRVALIGGAEIKISLQEGLLAASTQLDVLTSFTRRFSGSVQADGAFTSFSFIAIPKELLNLIAPAILSGVPTEVKLEVTIFGDIAGGGVETNKFVYWVDVCNGCMKVDQGLCTELHPDFTPREGGACNELQDVRLDCCTNSTGTEVCPAAAEEVPDPV